MWTQQLWVRARQARLVRGTSYAQVSAPFQPISDVQCHEPLKRRQL
jgi:hypothetical protein